MIVQGADFDEASANEMPEKEMERWGPQSK